MKIQPKESQHESRPSGISVEHFHRLKRVFVQILSHQVELLQNIVRYRDDVTADTVSLEDIQ